MYQARSKQDSYEQEASKTTTSKKQARSVPISHVHHGAGASAHDAEESPHGSASDGPTWHHRSLHITGQIARCEMLRSAVWRIWRSKVELVAAEACELGFPYLDGYTRDL